ncbi:MAG: SDR family NAD(P)-dependent oxidoreductase [Chloroflexota bacterium]
MSKIALITGAANGIGKALAMKLIREGYQLLLTDLSSIELGDVFGSYLNDKVKITKLDVTSWHDWSAALAKLLETFGQIDYLFNNAGVVEPGWVHEVDETAVDTQIDVNLKGMLFGLRIVSEQMVKQGHGHIINIVSLAGIAPVPGLGVYAATKHGMRGLSLTAALELRDKGVFVSAVFPDLVNTHMLDAQLDREETAVTFSGRQKPLTTDDVVKTILKVMRTKQLEIGLPESRRLLAKLVNFFPRLGLWTQGIIAAKGAKQQMKIQETVSRDKSN